MKKFVSAFLILSVILISSCKKDETPTGTNVTFKVDGTTKQASGDTKVTAMHSSTQKTLQLIGNLDNNQGISFTIQDYSGVGDYDVANADVTASYITDWNGGFNGIQLASTGTIKVTTSTDKLVKGTFQFIVRDLVTDAIKYTITEGTFEVKVTPI